MYIFIICQARNEDHSGCGVFRLKSPVAKGITIDARGRWVGIREGLAVKPSPEGQRSASCQQLLPSGPLHMGWFQALTFETEYAELMSPISAARKELEQSISFSFFSKELLNKTKALFFFKESTVCSVQRLFFPFSNGFLNYCIPLVSLWIAPVMLTYHLSFPCRF